MAFVSPLMPRRGEWRDHAPLTANQAGGDVDRWMGLDWRRFDPAIAPPVQ